MTSGLQAPHLSLQRHASWPPHSGALASLSLLPDSVQQRIQQGLAAREQDAQPRLSGIALAATPASSQAAASADALAQAILLPPPPPEGGFMDVDEATFLEDSIIREQNDLLFSASDITTVINRLTPEELRALSTLFFGDQAANDLESFRRNLSDSRLLEACEIDFEYNPIPLNAIVSDIAGVQSKEVKASRILCYFYQMFPGAKKIDASGMGLESMPWMISFFKSLEHLNLSHNQLRSVPEALEGSNSCKILDLSHNLIESREQPLDLPKTELLYMSGNQLTEIPHFKLPDGGRMLRELNVSANRITDMQNVGGLQRIERLDLSNNQIVNPNFPRGVIFPNMRWLNLASNDITWIFDQNFRDQTPCLEEMMFGLDAELVGLDQVIDEQFDILGKKGVARGQVTGNEVYIRFLIPHDYAQGPIEEGHNQIDRSLPKGTCKEVLLPDGTKVIRYNPYTE